MAEKMINVTAALSAAVLLAGVVLTPWLGFAGLKIASGAVLVLAVACLAHFAVKSKIWGGKGE